MRRFPAVMRETSVRPTRCKPHRPVPTLTPEGEMPTALSGSGTGGACGGRTPGDEPQTAKADIGKLRTTPRKRRRPDQPTPRAGASPESRLHASGGIPTRRQGRAMGRRFGGPTERATRRSAFPLPDTSARDNGPALRVEEEHEGPWADGSVDAAESNGSFVLTETLHRLLQPQRLLADPASSSKAAFVDLGEGARGHYPLPECAGATCQQRVARRGHGLSAPSQQSNEYVAVHSHPARDLAVQQRSTATMTASTERHSPVQAR